MKNTIILSTILLFLGFGGCKTCTKKEANHTTKQPTVTISHTLGTVEIIRNPPRVVALNYGSIESLNELGIAILGIPKSNLPEHLHAFKNNVQVADLGTIFDVDYEKLKALQPDVIFISSRLKSNYQELNQIAPTVFFLQIDKTDIMGSFKKNLGVFGEIFDIKSQTDSVIKEIESEIISINKKATKSEKTTLVILHNDGVFRAFGENTSFGSIIHKMFGFKQAENNLNSERKGQVVSSKFIQKVNPDYLFIIDRSAVVANKPTNKSEIENTFIQQTNAYKNNRIIYLNPEVWYLSGDGITSLKKMIFEMNTVL